MLPAEHPMLLVGVLVGVLVTVVTCPEVHRAGCTNALLIELQDSSKAEQTKEKVGSLLSKLVPGSSKK
jgi:hypothetical protein